jgi:hypothetical protein
MRTQGQRNPRHRVPASDFDSFIDASGRERFAFEEASKRDKFPEWGDIIRQGETREARPGPLPGGVATEERMNELEAKLNQIADSLLVQSQLVDRFERRTEERLPNHEGRLDRVEAVLEKLTDGHVRLVESHQRVIESHENLAARQAQTEAALQSLIGQIDRFLRGQQRNGHD